MIPATILFPKKLPKFKSKPHEVLPDAIHFTLEDSDNKVVISIVFGGKGLAYSNGVDTFEMFDFRMDDPIGHITIEEIEKHLIESPVL